MATSGGREASAHQGESGFRGDRFRGIFRDQAMASHAREITEKKLNDVLIAMSMDGQLEARRQERLRKAQDRREKQEVLIARLRNQLVSEADAEQGDATPTLESQSIDQAAFSEDDGGDGEPMVEKWEYLEFGDSMGPTSPESDSSTPRAATLTPDFDAEEEEQPPSLRV